MKTINFTELSRLNDSYKTIKITVANGQKFVALALSKDEILKSNNVLYIHVHRESKRCYIGQSLKECRKRWANGNGYKLAHQPKFRSAINSYGWDSFDSHILFFSDDRSILDQAEILSPEAEQALTAGVRDQLYDGRGKEEQQQRRGKRGEDAQYGVREAIGRVHGVTGGNVSSGCGIHDASAPIMRGAASASSPSRRKISCPSADTKKAAKRPAISECGASFGTAKA